MNSPTILKGRIQAGFPESELSQVALSQAALRRIRVRKEDSAFVYCVLEAQEGIASYSTLDFRPGDLHRDLELQVPVAFVEEVERVLRSLGEMIYDIPDVSSSSSSTY